MLESGLKNTPFHTTFPGFKDTVQHADSCQGEIAAGSPLVAFAESAMLT
jgi:hypothetical protein